MAIKHKEHESDKFIKYLFIIIAVSVGLFCGTVIAFVL